MMTFAIKSAIVLAALYIPYTLLLRSETFVRFNRVVLLCIMLLSVALPLVNIPWLAIATKPTPVIEFGQLTLQILEGETAAETPLDLKQLTAPDSELTAAGYRLLLSFIYLAGVAIVMAIRTMQLIVMHRKITRGCLWTQTEDDGCTIYCHADSTTPFSWFKQIVVSQADLDDCGETILTHERAHAALCHSADMLLAMTIQALQWFNPFVWLLTDSLQEIHEYEADRRVLANGTDIRQYQLLLIKKTVGRAWPAFTNSLKSNQLKKRFKMMLQKQSSPWRRARALYVLPIALAALSVFATNSTTPPQPSPLGEGNGTSVSAAANDSAAATSDTDGSRVMILENARIDREKNVVEFKGAHTETLPDTTATNATNAIKSVRTIGHNDDCLIVIDGVPQEGGKLEDIDQNNIESVYVIKDEEAKKRFGPKGANGVILITMKDDRIFDVCEELPGFPGGQEEMFKFLSQNLRYPVEAMEQGLQGQVITSFVIEKDGSISNVSVVKSPGEDWQAKEYEIEGIKVTGYGINADGSLVTEQQKNAIVASLGDEAVRVLNLMPEWTPGKQQGKNVRVKFTMPIVFRLN